MTRIINSSDPLEVYVPRDFLSRPLTLGWKEDDEQGEIALTLKGDTCEIIKRGRLSASQIENLLDQNFKVVSFHVGLDNEDEWDILSVVRYELADEELSEDDAEVESALWIERLRQSLWPF